MIVQVAVFNCHKPPPTNSIPRFQGSPQQGSSHSKNTRESRNNSNCPVVPSDWISNHSRTLKCHCCWHGSCTSLQLTNVYGFVSTKDTFILALLNLRSYLQLLFSVHGLIDSLQFIFWNSEEKYFQIFAAVQWEHMGLSEFKGLVMCLFLIWSASVYVDLLFN